LKCDYGDKNAKVGSKVEFTLTEGDKGKSATEVTGYGGATVVGGRSKGTITRWMADRGFGFLQPDEPHDQVFVGDRDIWTAAGAFNDGDRVEFDIKHKQSGKTIATYVTLEGEGVMQCGTCEGFGHRDRDCPGWGDEAEAGGDEAAAEY